jgi:FkbM family methyltransferase
VKTYRSFAVRAIAQIKRVSFWLRLLIGLSFKDKIRVISTAFVSRSQLQQEVFVILLKDFKKGGFFVEFGATDGIALSNTLLLEKKFNWNGILAEPGKNWHEKLSQNRNCNIDESCIWLCSGEEIEFSETSNGEFSTIEKFVKTDHHFNKRKKFDSYLVKTITLKDLLDKHNAPKEIDYLSIDTEGSEYEILKGFEFSEYHFDIITVEHNYSDSRRKISELLLANGYVNVSAKMSLWDDWYVSEKLLSSNKLRDILQGSSHE